MKVLSAKQIYEADQATIRNLPISSVDLMEKAGTKCFDWISEQFPDRNRPILVFCGMGNNGGDGLVVSRMLFEAGFQVTTFLVNFSDKRSDDFSINFERLQPLPIAIVDLNREGDLVEIPDGSVVIDCIFGIGLKRPASGLVKNVIQKINESQSIVIAIDIPSGLFPDAPVIDQEAVICADFTLTFQVPKLGFLLPENQNFTGKWEVIDIELDSHYLEAVESDYHLADIGLLRKMFKPREKFSHKGSFGHSLMIGGSFGKMGAMVMASKAALKAGSGLVSAYVPKCGYTILQTAVPEVMVEVDDEKYLEYFNFKVKPTALGIGPGMGMHDKTKKGFVSFLTNCKLPVVIDADGLNIIAEHNELGDLIPENSILTPHPKEFERLTSVWDNDYEKIDKLRSYAESHKCVVVLKGAHTAISFQGRTWFNSSGNPGLATAGSGDVLTGIITALLAQGYDSLEAAMLGVYIHGRTADLATEETESQESFIATDILVQMGRAFKELA